MKHLIVVCCLFVVNCIDAQLNISGERQLFLDDFLVESVNGLYYQLHRPIEIDSEKIPKGYYQTLVKQNDSVLFLYYRDYFDNYNGEKYDGNIGEVTRLKFSSNGKDWKDFVIEKENDSLKNVVLYQPPFNHNFTPFLDINPNALPARKYKAISGINKTKGLWLFYSEDGLNWTKRDVPLITSECKACFDSHNILFWSEVEKRYVLYYRLWQNGLRSIAKRTSTDLITWSEEQKLLINEKGEHLYTPGLYPYYREPNIYLGLVTRFFPLNGNTTDIVLISSRYGRGVQRKFKESIIRPGLKKQDWGNRSNYITLNGIYSLDENNMLILGRGKYYVIRKDGFTSLSSKYYEGNFITKPLILSANEMEINYATAAGGYIRVELYDNENKIIHSLNNNYKLTGNEVNGKYKFEVDNEHMGKIVKMKFYLKEADLYSFKFN